MTRFNWVSVTLLGVLWGCGGGAAETRCGPLSTHVEQVVVDPTLAETPPVETPPAEAPPAEVRALSEAPRRAAPNDQAWVTLLAQGHNAFVARLEMAPGAAVPEHQDTTEEYIHVLSGGGTIVIDGQSQAIEAGTTVFMPANVTVSYQNGPEQLVALQVFAGPEPAAKYDRWTPVNATE